GPDQKQTDLAIKVLQHLPKKVDFPLALAAFLAAVDTDSAMQLFKLLKPSNAHKKHLKFLLTNRNILLNADISLAKFKLLLAEPYFHDLYAYQWAIQKAQDKTTTPLAAIKKRALTLKGKQLKPKPLLTGHDIIALGVRPGPMVGLAAEEMYIAQLSEQLHTAEDARKWVKWWLEKHEQLEQ
ncbi:unnamed protein product, partial [marine sediment metagenome]